MALSKFTYSLSWSDFNNLSARPQGKKENAQIHPNISFRNFKLARNKRAVTLTGLDVNISLVSNDCWVVRDQMSDELLLHEQQHYDIVALGARELYNSFIGLTAESTRAIQSRISELHTILLSKLTAVDLQYDNQTENGKNKIKQQQWISVITVEKQNLNGSIDNLPK